jgi:CRISPR-associated endonuclease Csn1
VNIRKILDMSVKRILGLDLGTNSIGWAQVELDFKNKKGEVLGMGSRIIPMDASVMGKFDAGQSISQTADRTKYRGVRRLYQRDNLRRERLHRVLNVLSFLPNHYKESIDFKRKLGQFKPDTEVKLPYRKNKEGTYDFIFQESFLEMVEAFKANGYTENLPYDWTIYYLRKKALTKKIEKEELAWILLNFNQKRGYYQLRGEEEADKNKTYVQLNVKDVIDSGSKVKGNVLYDVTFDNGWEYDSQITKKEDWIGKTREFIVTTSTRKDGSIKRSYKQVNSEEDWLAIKEKTQNEIDRYNETNKTCGIASFIFDALVKDPTQKIRGKLVKTIERKYYREELEKILDKQIALHEDLSSNENLKNCVEELYPRNEAHQNTLLSKNFNHLFVNDIIFYQRPLKSKKSSIADCPYEARFHKNKDGEIVKQSLKAIPKSNPIYQEFRLWQFIHNLKIYQKEGEVDGKTTLEIDVSNQYLNEDSYALLFDKLNDTKDIIQKQFLAIFKLKEATHRWNFPEDKKYPCNDTQSQIKSRLSKIEGLDVDSFLTYDTLQSLWHLIYSVKDKKEYEKALVTFAEKNDLPTDSFAENFKRFPPFESSYGAYSEKAIKKLLPLMRLGSYWSQSEISDEVKSRINDITTRLNDVDYNIGKIEAISDDDVTKRLLKSFAKAKNRENPLKGLNTYQACYAVYNRHSEIGDIVQLKQPKDIDNYLNNFKQHSLRNPIVEQVVLETLRVVKDVWTTYAEKEIVNGKERYKPLFDEIHVELGREMKNDKKTRERISKANTERENTNERIKAILEELKSDPAVKDDVRPYSPSHQEILKIYEEGLFSSLYEVEDSIEKIRKSNKPTRAEVVKYKLWLEQGYISPYTGKIIPLTKLFSIDYQIEHIIPQSRYFDNSMNNKIICESAVNEEKDNKTAYEFLKQRGGSLIDMGHGASVSLFTLNDYERHCQTYFRKNKSKLELLLSEEIPEGFINRQLNDSRYISKVVKGLLSNIVREDGELEATSKNLVPVNGAITSKLKRDWGLNDKWNEIIAPRFKRLNELTQTEDFGFWDDSINAFRIQVPKELERNFSSKRIDHRHHALDALVIACTTKDHINYITSLNTSRNNFSLVSKLRATKTIVDNNGKERTVAKEYHKPWEGFTATTKEVLEKTVVSFKKNTRVINKTNNKTWQWVDEKGQLKKRLIKQEKGQNWAVRRSMHKETVSGQINIDVPKGKIATATRIDLTDLKTRKRLESITDLSIQNILNNHLKNFRDDKGNENFEAAFDEDGLDELNKNIQKLNNGKRHQPIKKVRLYEIGVKFAIGETGQKATKFVEAAKGTNLFFNIYWDDEKQKRTFETVPLNEVIAHQKQAAHLRKNERKEVPIHNTKGDFLFSLSPNNLVYIPNEEEVINSAFVDFKNLTVDQNQRIYKMISCTGGECHFIPSRSATEIQKNEHGTNSKSERIQSETILDDKGKPVMIKNCCWKLKIDRLGNLKRMA